MAFQLGYVRDYHILSSRMNKTCIRGRELETGDIDLEVLKKEK